MSVRIRTEIIFILLFKKKYDFNDIILILLLY